MSQDAAIRFRYELVGDGIQAVNALTGEVLKLAAAEETALGRARALGQAAARVPAPALTPRPPAGPPAPPPPPAGRTDAPPRPDPVRRDNPLLDEAFGVGRRDPAPRPGPPPGEERRQAGEDRLVRALETLTAALTRPGEGRAAARRANEGGRQGEDEAGMPAIRREPRREWTTPLARDERPEEADRAALPRGATGRGVGGIGAGLAAGATAAVGIGGAMARDSMQPFISNEDRNEQFARRLQIPVLNVGVADLLDIRKWAGKRQEGKDPDEEARKLVGIQNQDGMFRRPFEEFRRSYDTRRRELERRVQDTFGPFMDFDRSPVMPKPVDPGDYRFQPDFRLKTPQEAIDADQRQRAEHDRLTKQYRLDRATWERENARREAIGQAMARREFAPSLPLADLPDQSRDTLGERQTLGRRMGRLPAMDRVQEAKRELSAIDAQLAETRNLAEQHVRIMAGVEEEAARQDKLRAAAKYNNRPFDETEAAERMADARRAATTSARMLPQLDADILDLQTRRAQASGGVREADAGLNRVRLSQMREREQTAGDQARTLALMGPAGRAQAEFAMQLIRESGDVSMLPPEIVGMARPAFGRTIDVMAEQAGQQYVPQFRAQAPDEYRDTLSDARRRVDELAAEVRKFEQTNPGEVLKETFDAVKGMYSFWERLKAELEAFKKQVEAESRAKNVQ